MTKQTLPQDRQGILAKLQDDKLIVENAGLLGHQQSWGDFICQEII